LNAFALVSSVFGFQCLGLAFDARRMKLEKAGFRLRQAGYVTPRTFVGAQVG
jgi:hypothetical protein